MNQTIYDFLRRTKMLAAALDMENSCDAFMTDMQRGLCGAPSSLMMIPAYVSPSKSVPLEETVMVLDAGGTNLRAALCCFHETGSEIVSRKLIPMPGTGHPATLDTLMETLVALLQSQQITDRLGFCFSFPATITPKLDGLLIDFNKEVQIQNVRGVPLCQTLCHHMAKHGLKPPKFAVVNDTVAALLGGYGSTDPSQYDGYVGFILGTGTNCAYVESAEKIKAGKDFVGPNMVVNLEAGGYTGFPQGDYDRILDRQSSNPGEHLYEKMTAGGYLGVLGLELLRGAAAEGILASSFLNQLQDHLSTEELTDFVANPYGSGSVSLCCKTEEIREAVYLLLNEILERAARMVAVVLTGVLRQGNMGRDPLHPACIVVEGSTFHKAAIYQEKIRYHLKNLAEYRYHRYFRFLSVSDSNLKGAAVAALLV